MHTTHCAAVDAERVDIREWLAFALIGAFLGYVVLGAVATVTGAFGPLGSELWAIYALLACPALVFLVGCLMPPIGTPRPASAWNIDDEEQLVDASKASIDLDTTAATVAMLGQTVERIVRNAGAPRRRMAVQPNPPAS